MAEFTRNYIPHSYNRTDYGYVLNFSEGSFDNSVEAVELKKRHKLVYSAEGEFANNAQPNVDFYLAKTDTYWFKNFSIEDKKNQFWFDFTEIAWFNNTTGNNKEYPKNFWFGTTSVAWFDNSADYIKDSMPYIEEGYSSVAWFDNSVQEKELEFYFATTDIDWFWTGIEEDTKNHYWFNYSEESFFWNTLSNVREVPKVFEFGTTSIAWFDNSSVPVKEVVAGTWSLGVFEFDQYVSYLTEDTYDYEAIIPDLLYPELEYNWFDNSVPSIKQFHQNYVIPWGYGNEFLQFSLHFPAYKMDTQIDVAKVAKEFELGVQNETFIPQAGTSTLDISVLHDLNKDYLHVQYAVGTPLRRSLELQGDVLHDFWFDMDIQLGIVYDTDTDLQVQYLTGFEDSDSVDIQADMMSTVSDEGLEIAMRKVYNTDDMLDIAMYVDEEVVYKLDTQYVVYGDSDNTVDIQLPVYPPRDDEVDLGLQYQKVQNEASQLDIQSKVRFTTNVILDIQSEVDSDRSEYLGVQMPVYPRTPEDFKLDTQVTVYVPVPTDDSLGIQYKKVTVVEEALDTAFNIDRFNYTTDLGIQYTQSLADDFKLEVTYMTMIESAIGQETYVIPYGYGATAAQAFVRSVSYENLGVQANVSVIKEYPLDVQNKTLVNTEDSVDIQMFNAVNREYSLDVQAYNVVEKDFGLDFQNLVYLTDEWQMELSAFLSVNAEYSMPIQYGPSEINYNVPLELQAFNSVIKDFILDTQGNVAYIDTKESLDISLDILDLVYYMMYEGYNLIPWWSDGLGNWDNSVDKNWSKTEDATMADNLIQQLNDIGDDVPEEFEMLNPAERNFKKYCGLINTSLSNNVVKLYRSRPDKKYLTLGKSKRSEASTVEFKAGANVFFYDGIEETFNAAVRDKISNIIDYVVVWLPEYSEWELVEDDHPVYFYEDIDGKELPMPYVFIVHTTGDGTIEIER
jgi:hypothetical protein